MLTGKPAGKTTRLAEKGASARNQGKNKSLCPLEKGAGYSGRVQGLN